MPFAYAALFVVSGSGKREISIGKFAAKLAVDKYKLGACIRQMQSFCVVTGSLSLKEDINEEKDSPLRYLCASNEISIDKSNTNQKFL